MESESTPSCSGTNCTDAVVGRMSVVLDVPLWRVPAYAIGSRAKVFHILEEVHYCVEHEAVAKKTQSCLVPQV